MTQGALLFAFNNGDIDYLSMADWCAERIHRHLDIEVCVVTDAVDYPCQHIDRLIGAQATQGNTRWFSDLDRVVPWLNSNRATANDITPFDHTLVLDVDYIVSSSELLNLFQAQQDFLFHGSAYDVTGANDYQSLNHFGRHQMPMPWATVMCFRQSKTADMIFYHMSMIQQHWAHYRNLYGLGRSGFRNDMALGIAATTVYGHSLDWPTIPWKLANVDPGHAIHQIDLDQFEISWQDSDQRRRRIIVANKDLHAMGKRNLGDIIATNT